MIEKLLQKKVYEVENPIVLKSCTLFFRLNHFDIDDVFIFHKQSNYPYSTVGNLWLTGRIEGEYDSKGYLSTKIYTVKHYEIYNLFEEYSAEQTAVIGYYNKKRVLITGVSVTTFNLDFNEGLTCKFSFSELKFL